MGTEERHLFFSEEVSIMVTVLGCDRLEAVKAIVGHVVKEHYPSATQLYVEVRSPSDWSSWMTDTYHQAVCLGTEIVVKERIRTPKGILARILGDNTVVSIRYPFGLNPENDDADILVLDPRYRELADRIRKHLRETETAAQDGKRNPSPPYCSEQVLASSPVS